MSEGNPSSTPDRREDFVADLSRLVRAAGFTIRPLAGRVGEPKSTVADALRVGRWPRRDLVLKIVQACDGDRAEWAARWGRLNAADPPGKADPGRGTSPGSGAGTGARAGPGRRRLVIAGVLVAACLGAGGVGWTMAAHRTASSRPGSCQTATRHRIDRAGNLLDAEHRIIATTNTADVFYVTRPNAAPYTGRHYGRLERTGQWGYVDTAKLGPGTPACVS
ncbi:hypothetical protein ACFFWC_02830 [Plantactinospora siamensis]|uniref:Uncharacterized protein n=1 Tax=Plantactinospora siamensis TaxID=555372 RepID=A0ABV6NRS1_9ACTN